MRILITGSTGFIGNYFVRFLKGNGYNIADASDMPRLGERPPAGIFNNVDAIVHCAWSMNPADVEKNINGTRIIAEEAISAGVARQVFISSYSAWEDAPTSYGYGKWCAEQSMLALGCSVLRPGLVLGSAGLFANIISSLRHSRFIPLVDSGKLPISVIGIEDLAKILLVMLSKPSYYEVNAASGSPLMVDFLYRASEVFGTRNIFISVPSWLLLPIVKIISFFSIKLSVTDENIRGYLLNGTRTRNSHLADMVDAFQSWNQALTAACKACGEKSRANISC